MSGDVQPRKRKDKKKKKDELGLDEGPRGTAAPLGEGDVLLHAHSDHGTGGHWCAKLIFFSLLAVLITLIGLIILENRGLSELEASTVHTQYSGVLEGWLEDAPDDDHHDEHTLELKHPDDDHDDHEEHNGHDDDDHDDDDHEEEEDDHDDEHESDEEEEVEIEKIEEEAADDEEPISNELPALPEADDDDDDDDKKPDGGAESEDDQSADEADDGDFLQQDDDDDDVPPVVEPISAPKGKPFQEVDEADSSEVPVDTLAEEEEYERQQEELRRQQEEASHMWLKLGVGGALLLATHAVLRRAAAPRDEANEDEGSVREETPLPDRRMTIVPEQAPPPVVQRYERPVVKEVQLPEDIVKQIPMIIKSAATPLQVSMEDGSEPENTSEPEVEDEPEEPQIEENELFSDEEDEVEEIVEEEEEEEVIVPKKETPKEAAPTPKPATPTPKPTSKVEEKIEPEEENEEVEEDDEELDPDDVEIIEDEDLDEEEIEEEEISDVDDAELLSRLEAKYGRLPEPERPAGYKIPKDGGNSVDDEGWPGEPSDAYWGRQLNSAEREMHQDWLQ